MSWLSQWLKSVEQSPALQADLFKLIFEKFLLAGVVGLAAIVVAIWFELYKSALKGREELAKITLPRIHDVMVEFEKIFKLGRETIKELWSLFGSFDDWVTAMVKSSDIAVGGKLFPKNEAELPAVQYGLATLTMRQYLLFSAPNDMVRDVIRGEDFFTDPRQYELTGFLSMISSSLTQRPCSRADIDLHATRAAMARTVFVPFVAEPRKRYSTQLSEVSLLLMRNMPFKMRRKGRKAQKNILTLMDHLRGVINQFPANDLIRFEEVTHVSSDDLLTNIHAASLSQLHIILRAAR